MGPMTNPTDPITDIDLEHEAQLVQTMADGAAIPGEGVEFPVDPSVPVAVAEGPAAAPTEAAVDAPVSQVAPDPEVTG